MCISGSTKKYFLPLSTLCFHLQKEKFSLQKQRSSNLHQIDKNVSAKYLCLKLESW